jgi:lysine 2,3-aminomutase
VLLRGVNDSLETMRELMRGLLRIKVRPYYIFHCDPVIGAGHLRTSVWKGMEIMEGLRGHMSGLGIPTYVVDSPHGGGKIPLMPNYLVSASDDAVILRNYEGMLVRYQAEDKPATAQPTATRGVSSLLQGTKTVLMPENSERMARRRLHVLSNEETNGHGNGCCGSNGHGNNHHGAEALPARHQLGNGCCGGNGHTEELLPLNGHG